MTGASISQTQCLWLVRLLWFYRPRHRSHVAFFYYDGKWTELLFSCGALWSTKGALWILISRGKLTKLYNTGEINQRRLEDRLIINHLCTTVQHSHAFQHLSFFGNVDFFFLLVFHNLWPAYCFKKKETAKYHCVLQIFVCSTGQHCCGWIPSVMFTLELGSCFTLCCYSMKEMWKLVKGGCFCCLLISVSCSNWATWTFGLHYSIWMNNKSEFNCFINRINNSTEYPSRLVDLYQWLSDYLRRCWNCKLLEVTSSHRLLCTHCVHP